MYESFDADNYLSGNLFLKSAALSSKEQWVYFYSDYSLVIQSQCCWLNLIGFSNDLLFMMAFLVVFINVLEPPSVYYILCWVHIDQQYDIDLPTQVLITLYARHVYYRLWSGWFQNLILRMSSSRTYLGYDLRRNLPIMNQLYLYN